MIRRLAKPSVRLLVMGVLLSSLPADVVHARGVHASSGSAFNPDPAIGMFGFTAGNEGSALIWTGGANTGGWLMPLLFDTVGAKTVVVHGRVANGGFLRCQARALDALGNIVSSSATVEFTVTPSFTSITLNLPPATAGAMGLLACSLAGNVGTAFLLGADYNP